MENLLIVALITGLTAGGLSCFAVQGGLLAGSIAHQVEKDVQARSDRSASKPAASKSTGKAARSRPAGKPAPGIAPASPRGYAQPILLFMAAKIAVYTLLGALLGALGSAFSFSTSLKGFIQIGIGLFLVGNALRMFDVHPIFRYFNFEPPARVTRYIRRLARRDPHALTPLFLGALTVLIPCGVTQSMMAVAMGTGSPALGAATLFAFTLGTSPTFVAISWLASRLGGLFQKAFYRVVAVVVLLLGLYSLDGGLSLAGSPLSVSGLIRTRNAAASPAVVVPGGFVQPGPAAGQAAGTLAGQAANTPVTINVYDSGYSPSHLVLPANQEITLRLVTQGTRSCSRAFFIPDLGLSAVLPETGEETLALPAQPAGTQMQFMCSMGMYGGFFEFE